jgi:hypothetical protein
MNTSYQNRGLDRSILSSINGLGFLLPHGLNPYIGCEKGGGGFEFVKMR